MLRPFLFFTGLCLLVLYWRQPPTLEKPRRSRSVSSAPNTGYKKRIVAVGDLHSDLPQALAVLRMAKLVDVEGNWSGGQDTLVQTVSTTLAVDCPTIPLIYAIGGI